MAELAMQQDRARGSDHHQAGEACAPQPRRAPRDQRRRSQFQHASDIVEPARIAPPRVIGEDGFGGEDIADPAHDKERGQQPGEEGFPG